VPAGGGNLQSALGVRLAAHVGEVTRHRVTRRRERGDRARLHPPIQEVDEFADRLDTHDLKVLDKRCLRRVRRWYDETRIAAAAGAQGYRQRPVHRPNRTAQRELAADGVGRQLIGRDLATGGEQRHSEREVEARAGLPHVRGREIGGKS
jgi:hypothetical protein